MTAAVHSLAGAVLETTQQVACRASRLQPPEGMDSSQMRKTCLASGGCQAHQSVPEAATLEQPLQQLQRLQLSPEVATSAADVADQCTEQSEGGSSSSSEDCGTSSSSSHSSRAAAGQQQQPHELDDVPSSSATTNSHPDEAAWEPLLRDNPDRFTLSPIQ